MSYTQPSLFVSVDPHQRLKPTAALTRPPATDCYRVPCLHDDHLLVFNSVLSKWGQLEQLVLCGYERIAATFLMKRTERGLQSGPPTANLGQALPNSDGHSDLGLFAQ